MAWARSKKVGWKSRSIDVGGTYFVGIRGGQRYCVPRRGTAIRTLDPGAPIEWFPISYRKAAHLPKSAIRLGRLANRALGTSLGCFVG
jgi:hypothetical protein